MLFGSSSLLQMGITGKLDSAGQAQPVCRPGGHGDSKARDGSCLENVPVSEQRRQGARNPPTQVPTQLCKCVLAVTSLGSTSATLDALPHAGFLTRSPVFASVMS